MVFFLYLIAGLSTYYLMSSLAVGIKEKKLIGIVSSFIYMYNPFHIVDGVMTVLLPFAWAVLPLILGLYINGIRKKNLKYAFFLGLTSYILLEQFPNLLWSIVCLLLIVTYTIFHFLTSRNIQNEFLFIIKFVSVSLAIAIIVNLWLIVLVISIGITNLANPIVIRSPYFFNHAQLTEVFRLLGFWAFYEYLGFYKLGYGSNPVVVITSFLLPILAFSAILIRKEKNTIFFTLMALLAIFIAKGPNPPFGEIFEYILTHNIAPLILIIGDNKYWIMLLALTYSVLIGTTFGFILTRITKNLKRHRRPLFSFKIARVALAVCIMISIGMSSWPLFSGVWLLGPSYIVPNYYNEVNAWLDAQYDKFKILVLPLPYTYLSYDWGYVGANPYYRLFTKPMPSFSQVHYFSLGTEKKIGLLDELINYISKLDSKEIDKPRRLISFISGLLNVKYIILDTSVNTYEGELDRLIAILNSDINLQLYTTFGKLIIYENRMFTPHIYVANDLMFTGGTFDDLIKISEDREFIPGKTAIIFEEDFTASLLKKLVNVLNGTQIKLITINERDPTNYSLTIESSGPFVVVFGEMFDPNWKAYINGELIKQHFIVNYFANGWLINKTGKFTITIEYLPQKVLKVLSLASCLLLIIITISVLRKSLQNLQVYKHTHHQERHKN
jgi:hypothetical protein